MNSVVCISHVPDTESRIKVAAGGKKIDEAGLKFIVSPYDEIALEEAIRLKDAKGGDVTVVTFGPDRAQQALREALARGATKALHVKGESGDADSLGIAKVLAAAIKTVEHDVVFFGKQGVGTDNGLVGPMVAELLGYPQVNVVTHLEIADGKLTGRVIGPIVNAQRKAELLETIAQAEGVLLDQVIAVGDGANDALMLERAGLGIAFHAKPKLRESADTSISASGLDAILYLLGISGRELHEIE